MLHFSFSVCIYYYIDSLTGSNPSDRYPSYETPRADSYGCYCVPYDQCLPHEVARKEDGIAGIDPRNLNRGKGDIEAIGLDEVVITDGNGTIVSHHKKTEADDKVKSRKRRDAPNNKQDAEPVSFNQSIAFRGVIKKILKYEKSEPLVLLTKYLSF